MHETRSPSRARKVLRYGVRRPQEAFASPEQHTMIIHLGWLGQVVYQLIPVCLERFVEPSDLVEVQGTHAGLRQIEDLLKWSSFNGGLQQALFYGLPNVLHFYNIRCGRRLPQYSLDHLEGFGRLRA